MQIKQVIKFQTKRLATYIVSLLLVISVIFNITLLTNHKFRVSTKDLYSIIIFNSSTNTAKEITNKQDIVAVCNEIDATDMHMIKNPHYKAGGTCYIFILKYISNEVTISYLYGEILKNNGNVYQINSTALEKFWDLNYDEKGFHLSGFD